VSERRWVRPLAVAGIALVVVVAIVVLVPPLFVPDGVLPSVSDTLRLRNEVRGSLLTGVGGLGALTGLYLTWRQLGVTSKSSQAAMDNSARQLRLSREHEVNERLANAVEQLGHEKTSVRIAGIAVLELLAKEDPAKRDTIAQILIALVRDLVPLDPEKGSAAGSALASRCPAAEWALVALGRTVLKGERWSKRYRLNMLDLTGANLEGLELVGADLARSCLDDAYLRGTDLTDAWLVRASARRADFRGAAVTGMRVMGTNLADAKSLPNEATTVMLGDGETQWPADGRR
jgi:uncharacterized protein YjbI with pentapeptide repeats